MANFLLLQTGERLSPINIVFSFTFSHVLFLLLSFLHNREDDSRDSTDLVIGIFFSEN